jgi:hypothetical protein
MSRATNTFKMLIPMWAVALMLTGCPGSQESFDIWLLNTSDNVTLTNIRIVNESDTSVEQEFPEDLATNTGRVVGDIDASPYANSTLSIEVNGETGGEILENVDTTVTTSQPIAAGDIIVVVVRGNSVLNYDAEIVPLESGSKGMLLLRQHLRGANL